MPSSKTQKTGEAGTGKQTLCHTSTFRQGSRQAERFLVYWYQYPTLLTTALVVGHLNLLWVHRTGWIKKNWGLEVLCVDPETSRSYLKRSVLHGSKTFNGEEANSPSTQNTFNPKFMKQAIVGSSDVSNPWTKTALFILIWSLKRGEKVQFGFTLSQISHRWHTRCISPTYNTKC